METAPYAPPFELSSGRDNITGGMGRIYQKLTVYVEVTIARKEVSRQYKERSSHRDETEEVETDHCQSRQITGVQDPVKHWE